MFELAPWWLLMAVSDPDGYAAFCEEMNENYTPLLPDPLGGGHRIPKCRLFGEQAYLTGDGEIVYET